MKNMKLFFIFILAFSLTGVVQAQNCGFFAVSEGTLLGYDNLNKRGKVTSKSRTSCYDVSKDSQGLITYSLKTEIFNAKDVQLSSREYQMECNDGKFTIDTESYADPDAIEGFQELAVDVNNQGVTYPDDLSVGMSLPDAIITMRASAEGKSKNTYVIIITDRKVISYEPVTVPADTFDCYKITYELELKSSGSSYFDVTEYIAQGVGKIKTETYNDRGKLTSTSILVELSQ